MEGEEKNPRKEKRRKFWSQELKNKKGKKTKSAGDEGDCKQIKLDKKNGGKVKKGDKKDKTKGKNLNRKKDKRKKGGVKEKDLSHRGFKSGQKSTNAVKSTEAVTASQKVELRVPPVKEKTATEPEGSEELTSNTPGAEVASFDAKKKRRKKKRRYLLFVGNLPQTASREDIVAHFEHKGVRVAEFRLLSYKDSGKSKGCGFMEFGGDKDMQNALKFHRSLMRDKRINVEVTCGGGGKSERRREKITEKNRTMRKNKAMAKPFKPKASS